MDWDETARRLGEGHTIALAMACLFFAEKSNTEIGEFIERLEAVLGSDLVDGKTKWDSQPTHNLLKVLQRFSHALRSRDDARDDEDRGRAHKNDYASRYHHPRRALRR